jgi:hypothetical protein
MKLISMSTAILGLAIPAGAADTAPADAVRAAVQRLREAPSYAWVTSASCGGKSGFAQGPVEGRAEKDGPTRWKIAFGDHHAEAIVKAGVVVVKTDGGWMRPDDPRGPGAGPPPEVGSSPPAEGRRGPHKKHRRHKEGFLAHRVRSMQNPAEMASELAGKVETWQSSGNGFRGELSADAVKELLAVGGPGRDGKSPPALVNSTGSVVFELKDGTLSGLELHLAGTVTFNGNEVMIDRTTSVTIRQVGSAGVDVPEEALKLLESDAPPASPGPEKKRSA